MAVVTNVGVKQSPHVRPDVPRPIRRRVAVAGDGRRPARLAPSPYRPGVRQCAPRPPTGSIGWLVAAGVIAFLVVFGIGWTMSAGPAASVPTHTVTVQVHQGETLWSVAHDAAPAASTAAVVDKIRQLNGLKAGSVLHPGELLQVPSAR